MDTKDWILLFAPIISNGVIVFLVQFFVTERFKRRQEKKQIQNDTYKHLYSLLQSLNTGSLDLYLQKNKLFDFDIDVQEKNALIEQLLIYFNSNLNLFLSISWRMNDITESWNDVYSLWKEKKPLLIIDGVETEPTVELYVSFFDLIVVWQSSVELLKTEIVKKL